VSWKLYFSKDARKDAAKLKTSNLRAKADTLLDILEKDPFTTPPPYEKLVGDRKRPVPPCINERPDMVGII